MHSEVVDGLVDDVDVQVDAYGCMLLLITYGYGYPRIPNIRLDDCHPQMSRCMRYSYF